MVERLLPWALWLEQTSIASSVRSSTWAYPAVEIVHLIGLGLLVGTAVAFDVRLLGGTARLPVDALAAHLLPWARLGLAMLAVTGALLFAANASELIGGVLAIKLAAIMAAVVNATVFHRGVFRTVHGWDWSAQTPGAAKVAALVSLTCWLTALVCGRLLAYV